MNEIAKSLNVFLNESSDLGLSEYGGSFERPRAT